MADAGMYDIDSPTLLELTTRIVAAHVAHNATDLEELPHLIERVHGCLTHLNGAEPEDDDKPRPAIPVKASITPDYLVCLEDGKKLKMLKRHLRTNYNMTPEQYRTKWGLPPDYPMVAPNYAAQRSAFAKKIGLGKGSAPRKPGTAAAAQ